MSTHDQDLLRKYAALAYALGCTRGVLRDVLDGEASLEDVRRIYEASATSRIAKSIGLAELDMSLNWNDYITGAEKYRIKGL